MQLIKDKQVAEDNWRYISDDSALNSDFNIVSLTRWSQDHGQLSETKHLGLRLAPDVIIEEIAVDLSLFQLIELFIPVFTDGRAFSHARLLRSRYNYTGDIRVSGDFMADQLYYLSRVGASSFELNDQDNAQLFIQSMEDFSVDYQKSVA